MEDEEEDEDAEDGFFDDDDEDEDDDDAIEGDLDGLQASSSAPAYSSSQRSAGDDSFFG